MKKLFKRPYGPLLVVLAYLGTVTLLAQAPAWWTNRAVLLTGPGVVTNDFAPINQGQLKWLATQAKAEFDEKWQVLGGAGSNITALVAGFSTNNNYRPVNLGQLKNTVAPFYERLQALDLASGYPAGAGSPYPWSNSTNPPRDFALANIGQAKYVFSFDLAGVNITTNTDTDADGLPDWWEMLAVGNRTGTAPQDDPMGIGLPNSERLRMGIAPTQRVNVVTLGQSDLTFEVKAVESHRSKTIGFQDFASRVNPELTPAYFLQQEEHEALEDSLGMLCQGEGPDIWRTRYIFWLHDYLERVVVPDGVRTGGWQYAWNLFIHNESAWGYDTYDETAAGSAVWASNEVCTGRADYQVSRWLDDLFGPPLNTNETATVAWTNQVHTVPHEPLCSSYNCEVYPWSYFAQQGNPMNWVEDSRTSNSLIYTIMIDGSLLWGQTGCTNGEAVLTLSQVFTTAILNQIVTNDLAKEDPFNNLAWDQQWSYDFHGNRLTQMSYDAKSYRYLTADEQQLEARKIIYRVSCTNQALLQSGTVYRLNLAHIFTPDGATTNCLQAATNLFVQYTGGSQIVFNASGTLLNAPATHGEVNIYILKVDLDADTDRDGTVEDTDDDSGEDAWTLSRGAFTIPASVSSLYQPYKLDILPPVVVRKPPVFPTGHKLRLHRQTGSSNLRILDSSSNVVVALSDDYDIPGPYPLTNDLTFYAVSQVSRSGTIGANAFEYLLDLQELDAANSVVCTDTIRLKVAPMILPWDGDSVERVYATTLFPAGVTNIPNMDRINSSGTQWAQDFVKFTKSQFAVPSVADVVADLRHSDAGDFVQQLCPATGTLRRVEWDTDGDGGNVMVTPPLTDAFYGKGIVGDKWLNADPYIEAQRVQTNVITTIPTSWLLVGHVDEVISFANASTVLISDPWTAANLIHDGITNNEGTNILWYGTTPLSDPTTKKSYLEIAVETTGGGAFKTNAIPSPGMSGTTNSVTLTFPANVFDPGDFVRVDNEVLLVETVVSNSVTFTRQQAGTSATTHSTNALVYALSDIMRWNLPIDSDNAHDHMVDVTNALSSALGSYSLSYVKLPVLFHRVGGDFFAGSANLVNCLVYPGQGIYMQTTGNADFDGYVTSHVSGAVFINIWDQYHRYKGEVHCGTATRRTVNLSPPWWDKVPGWQ